MIPAWLLGCAVASGAFLVTVRLGVLALGISGLVLTPLLAFWAGAGAASMMDVRRSKRDAVIIALFVVILLIGFLWQTQTRLGTQGGPNF